MSRGVPAGCVDARRCRSSPVSTLVSVTNRSEVRRWVRNTVLLRIRVDIARM
ncbi:MAG: hypothetical protein GY820_21815 [Gammaproteobacteria bacterium]|nr:hypothetical protein [Gammaproteobacteria bacterium]